MVNLKPQKIVIYFLQGWSKRVGNYFPWGQEFIGGIFHRELEFISNFKIVHHEDKKCNSFRNNGACEGDFFWGGGLNIIKFSTMKNGADKRTMIYFFARMETGPNCPPLTALVVQFSSFVFSQSGVLGR